MSDVHNHTRGRDNCYTCAPSAPQTGLVEIPTGPIPYEPFYAHRYSPIMQETGVKVHLDRAHLADLLDISKMLECLLDGTWIITDREGNPLDLSSSETNSKEWTSRYIAQLRNKVEIATI